MRNLSRSTVALAGLIVVGGVSAALTSRTADRVQPSPQQPRTVTSPVPTLAPDTLKVEGTVSVGNVPTVYAMQLGDWNTNTSGTLTIKAPAPAFLQSGQTYVFRWPGIERPETYQILDISGDGWVQAKTAGGKEGVTRWLNPTQALTIENVKP